MRYGFIDKGLGIPKGVVFVDSILAIREIEDGYLKEVFEATKELASQRAYQEVAAYEDITADGEQDTTATTSTVSKVQNVADAKEILVPAEPPAAKRVRIKGNMKYALSLDGQIYDDHPLVMFNTREWSAAKMRRISPDFFRANQRGDWEFNYVGAKSSLRDDLPVLYETVVKTQYGAHFTQDDAEALVQICVAYGKAFQDYIDYKAAYFPF
ncbi:hypothetical protein OESDEN_04195 [Oesophagostomum dentatum]|uniref:Uncharacterized protein n=1 Tax=Oesophagostomum dentatum TaxID=61180 RepID=A0A0B1TF01_OESDE|nr:hypothetical protein OESDEN_04195 [Oesophagostomum dentatum]